MRKNIGQKFMAAFALFVVLAFATTDAFAAYSVKKIIARFSAVAAETLTTGQVVMLKTDSLAYKADANDAALRPAIGIIGKGGATGATVEIITIGTLSGWTALTEGAPGYLSETPAAVTQSAPAYSQQVGQAILATTYLFNFQNYFDSSSLTVLGTMSGATPLVLEGATANDFETSITVTDPTAARTVTLADASGTVVLSTLATNAPDVANSVTGASNKLVFEGATDADGFQTFITPTDATADRTITLPDDSGTAMLTTLATNKAGVANSVTADSNKLTFEGATGGNGFQTWITPADPTADRTFTLPDTSGTVMVSSLATNAPDIANSVWGMTNGLAMGGATGADGFELQLKPMGDPAADKIIYFPVLNDSAAIISTLTTNDVDVANSIWGISNGLAMGGATGADGFELQLKPMGDPSADKSILFPVLTNVSAMISTLTTNDVNVANSVWGVSNGLAFGGASGADGFETTLTVTDPTSDKTVTIPNRTGQVQIASAASVLTPGAAVALTVSLSNVYTDTVTDNEDQTITFSGAGTAGDEINIIFTTAGTADEVITFHATLVSSVGTLTLGTDAGKYYVIRFISDGSHWFEVSRTAVQT